MDRYCKLFFKYTWLGSLSWKRILQSYEQSGKGIQLICQWELPWFVFAVFKHNICPDKRRIIEAPGLIWVLRRSRPTEWPEYKKNNKMQNTTETELVSVSCVCVVWEVAWTVWKIIWECIKDIFLHIPCDGPALWLRWRYDYFEEGAETPSEWEADVWL